MTQTNQLRMFVVDGNLFNFDHVRAIRFADEPSRAIIDADPIGHIVYAPESVSALKAWIARGCIFPDADDVLPSTAMIIEAWHDA